MSHSLFPQSCGRGLGRPNKNTLGVGPAVRTGIHLTANSRHRSSAPGRAWTMGYWEVVPDELSGRRVYLSYLLEPTVVFSPPDTCSLPRAAKG
jgi:hypothetical protein